MVSGKPTISPSPFLLWQEIALRNYCQKCNPQQFLSRRSEARRGREQMCSSLIRRRTRQSLINEETLLCHFCQWYRIHSHYDKNNWGIFNHFYRYPFLNDWTFLFIINFVQLLGASVRGGNIQLHFHPQTSSTCQSFRLRLREREELSLSNVHTFSCLLMCCPVMCFNSLFPCTPW